MIFKLLHVTTNSVESVKDKVFARLKLFKIDQKWKKSCDSAGFSKVSMGTYVFRHCEQVQKNNYGHLRPPLGAKA